MPRGRKRPPQDSIDSILLALSNNDNIDSDTLSHYFDRLDEEWTEGARNKVLHLLRTNNEAAHNAAVLIFTELATEFDLGELEDVIADPTVSDMAKLTLSPVLKELNSNFTDDDLVASLHDPEAAIEQMQGRLLEMIGQSEIGVETVLEDALAMPLEKRLAFIFWLGTSHDPRAASLLIPLLDNSTTKVVSASIEALEELGPNVAHQSIPALNYLIAHTSNRALKQAARAALGRMTMQSAPGMEDMAMAEAHQYHLPLHEVRVSFIDGSGSQMIMFSWVRPDGMLKGVNILYQDQWGIKDCFGTDEMDADYRADFVAELEDRGFGSFQVPLDYGRALIAEARAVNKKTRHKVPIAYTIWRPFIEENESSPRKKGATTETSLEAVSFTEDVARLAKRGDELYQMPEFMSWMFEPLDQLEPYIDRFWVNRSVLDMPGPTSRKRGRKGRVKEQDVQHNLAIISRDAISALIDDAWRSRYEAILLRQGLLLQFADRQADAKLVQAVAAALHPGSSLPPEDQPFLHAMMRLSIEQGPIRAMMEALESGDLGLLDFLADNEM